MNLYNEYNLTIDKSIPVYINNKVNFKNIIIKINDLNKNEIINELKNYSFNIYIEHLNVFSLDLDFIYRLEGYQIYNDNFIINLPFYYLFEISDTPIVIKLKSNYSKIKFENVLLIGLNINKSLKIPNLTYYQSIYSISTTIISTKSKQAVIIPNLLKGIFMKKEEIKYINNITFICNYNQFVFYDKFDTYYNIFELNNDLLYISFSNKLNYKNNSIKSYDDSVNFSQIYRFILDFEVDLTIVDAISISFYFLIDAFQ